jgi:hypothetical protein
MMVSFDNYATHYEVAHTHEGKINLNVDLQE